MKCFTQLPTLALSVLLVTASAAATPAADIEVREAAPVAAPDALPAPVHLEKRKKKKGSSSNTTSDAVSLMPDGTFQLAGVAFLGSAMLLLA